MPPRSKRRAPEASSARKLSGQNGAKVVDLATVAPAQPPVAGPGRGKKAEDKTDRPEGGPFSEAPNDRQAQRLRAILRAPEAAQELYKADLLPQKLAARLGPKNPTPEQAAEVTAIAQTAAQVVKERGKPRDALLPS